MPGLKVAIIGAGIGGLTAALALAGDDHDITIAERRTGFGETGAGIQLSPNASRVLIALGLGAGLNRISAEPAQVLVRSLRSGAELGAIPLGRTMRDLYGAPYMVAARADLHTILLDAVRSRPNVRLLVGRSFVSAKATDRSAELVLETTAGQREALVADLVIGADGLWSAARTAIGDRRAPRYSGFAASRALVPSEACPEFTPGDTGLWLGSGRHVVHYAIGGGRLINVVVIERRAESRTGWSEAEPGEALISRFADAPTPLRRLLAAPESWARWSLFELPARRMAQGRIALLGDAAHPVLPYLAQGGALAIEDAASLAAELHRKGAEVAAALADYARARLPRVRRVQEASRRNGRIYHLGGPAALARDLVLRRSRPEALRDRYAWVYGWRPQV